MTTLPRLTLVAALCTVVTLPAIGALYHDPAPEKPAYGTIVMSVNDHFALADRDHSDTLSLMEYMDISQSLKQQAAAEARADFRAMDMDDDGALSLREFYGEMPSNLTL